LNGIAPDLIGREQCLDFLRNRTFRQTMLIRDGPPLDRKVSPGRVKTLWIAAALRADAGTVDLRSDKAVSFTLLDGRGIEARLPIAKAAFKILAERWPVATAFADLYTGASQRLGPGAHADAAQRDVLAAEIMRCFVGGAVELHCCPSPFAVEPGERPTACILARLQATRGGEVTNRRHELMPLDESAQALLARLDGTRSRNEIAALLWPDAPESERVARLTEALAALGTRALLVPAV